MDAGQLINKIRPLVQRGVVPGAVVGVLNGGNESLAAVGKTEPTGHRLMPVDALMRISQ